MTQFWSYMLQKWSATYNIGMTMKTQFWSGYDKIGAY